MIIRFLDKIDNALVKATRWVALFCLGMSVTFAFVEVITRYIFDFSTPWIAEISKYLVICICFLLVGPIVKTGGHITFTFVLSRFEGRARQVVELLVAMVGLVVAIYVAWYSIELVQLMRGAAGMTESRLFYAWWFYTALPVGMIVLALFYLEQVLRRIALLRGAEDRN